MVIGVKRHRNRMEKGEAAGKSAGKMPAVREIGNRRSLRTSANAAVRDDNVKKRKARGTCSEGQVLPD